MCFAPFDAGLHVCGAEQETIRADASRLFEDGNDGRVPMQALPERQECPEVSPLQRDSAEIVKRVRKLRWIGMEEEADQLEAMLIRRCADARCGCQAD